MKIEFRDMQKYANNAPGIADLQGKTLDCRGARRGDVLFIVASYHDGRRLKRMLDSLSRQSSKNFDVAVVYGKGDPFVKNPRIPIIHMERKVDLGCAGAFYLGQLIALRDGYKYHLATDVDKLPYGKDSLKMLYDAAEKNSLDLACGKFVFEGLHLPPDRTAKIMPVNPPWIFPYIWGLARTDKLLKTGLYPLPLYIGTDDVEFNYRLHLSGIRKKSIGTVFRTYYPALRLFRILSTKGYDRTDSYQRMFYLFNMPEASFTQFCHGSVAGDALNYLRVALPYLFISNIYLRMLEKRVPAYAQYRAFVKDKKFHAPFFSGVEPQLQATKIRKMAPNRARLHNTLTLSAFSSTFSLFSGIAKNPAARTDLELVLSDECVVVDDEKNAYYQVHWNRKIGAGGRALILAQATADTVICTARAFFNAATGTHILKEYGLEQVRIASSS